MRLRIDNDWIEGDGIRFQGSYPVLSADVVDDRVLVIYDWMAFDRGSAAKNLFCYDRSGHLLWRAEDIGQGAVDAYTGLFGEDPLWIGNFSGFSCRIDLASGKVLQTIFTK